MSVKHTASDPYMACLSYHFQGRILGYQTVHSIHVQHYVFLYFMYIIVTRAVYTVVMMFIILSFILHLYHDCQYSVHGYLKVQRIVFTLSSLSYHLHGFHQGSIHGYPEVRNIMFTITYLFTSSLPGQYPWLPGGTQYDVHNYIPFYLIITRAVSMATQRYAV